MRVNRLASLALIALASAALPAGAKVTLGGLFDDHMVLQRDVACPLWGTATPDARVEVTIDGKAVAAATADADGAFTLRLPKLTAGGPHTIVVADGEDPATLRDVLVGDVWLCSGQSNMQWDLNNTNDREAEIAAADHPTVRLFSVPRIGSATPLREVSGEWMVCSPRTVPSFSAVAYFFGRRLNRELNVPIGLIHSSLGGTPAEAWTPLPVLERLEQLPAVARQIERRSASESPAALRRFEADHTAWLKASNRWDAGPDATFAAWKEPDHDARDWETMTLPRNWRRDGIPDGVMWFRKEITVPPERAGQPMTVSLGRIDEFDRTYFNGASIGATGQVHPDPWSLPRVYKVPADGVRAGRNVIAVRVFDSDGEAGLVGPPEAMVATIGEGADALKLPLDGAWTYRMESVHQPATANVPPKPTPPMRVDHPNAPAALYNGMIAPLGAFGLKGAIWYQGESNASRHEEYLPLLSAMIGGWRAQFEQGDFPFYVVGLANFLDPVDDPNALSHWAGIREAQRRAARQLKHVGTTVTMDIGEARDIHPRNKQEVGRRLALMALADTYGRTLVSRGPTFARADFDGGAVRVSFDHVGGGLEARGAMAKSFALAGDDGTFAWADARIDGDAVVLTASGVARPTRVRYAWADNPRTTLYNAEGLPAEPFEVSK